MKLDDIQPTLHVLVGLPGSGKSTWCEKNVNNANIISTDNYIEKKAKEAGKTYSEVFSDYIKEATSGILDELRDSIDANANIVWDQTNLTEKKRRWICKTVPAHYRKIAVVFNVTPGVLADRLQRRAAATGKNIPQNIMDSMNDSYTPPTLAEGFDEIVHV